jgi:hypothetical protein
VRQSPDAPAAEETIATIPLGVVETPAPRSDASPAYHQAASNDSSGVQDALALPEVGGTLLSPAPAPSAAPDAADAQKPAPADEDPVAAVNDETENEPDACSAEANVPPGGISGFVSGLFRRSASLMDQPSPLAESPVEEDSEGCAPAAEQELPDPAPEPSAVPEQFDRQVDPARAILETRFGVNLSATTVRHRLDGVRRQWNGREVRWNEETLVFLMKPPRSYWQRWAAKQVALEVHIHLQEAPPLVPAPTEVSVAIMPADNELQPGEPVAKALGQMLLESIRAALQVNAKGRGHERLPWPHPLKLWPVHAGGRLGEPVDCQGKDLSLNGIGFYMPGEPPPKVIRLQLPRTDQTPAMTVPARVVRVQATGDGWHEVGAILLMR